MPRISSCYGLCARRRLIQQLYLVDGTLDRVPSLSSGDMPEEPQWQSVEGMSHGCVRANCIAFDLSRGLATGVRDLFSDIDPIRDQLCQSCEGALLAKMKSSVENIPPPACWLHHRDRAGLSARVVHRRTALPDHARDARRDARLGRGARHGNSFRRARPSGFGS